MMGLEHLTPSSLIVIISTGVALLVGLFMPQVKAELTPPYFNLATGRKIYATATCGMDTDGPELYCKLVGANTENDHIDYSVIQGQVCDYCDPSIPEKNHAPEHAIDGTESWWQSPPLSRGMKFNEVNLTIDFGQEFHVAYLFIRMGNSPRPGLWTLEKSSDYGKTWTPWQHFSDTPADCETYFGKDTYKPITNDDDVICTTEYSKIVPLENGEIPVMLLNDRPSSTNYFNSSVLQEWTRATNVRIRLLRTKNLLGHLMSVARQDPTVTRRYFYSIKDISIGGRCMCNGHADTCDVKDPKSPVRILACRCQHHTCGIQCNECCPGFEQKKWRQNTNARAFECEPCNCHGHTNECVYDEETDRKRLSLDIHGRYDGGGRCLNCQHNTEGINCNKCKSKYYRPAGKHWNETDVCHPCQCDYFYSTGNCMEETGICECRKAFKPPSCDTCAYGYYGYPNCRECECNLNGTDGYHCEAVNGECPCKINFSGHYCKQCAEGYYSFPECKACECNQIGSISNDCDLVTGQCKCLSSFGGDQCERCKHGYYNYPKCQYCDCDVQGTEDEICDKRSGQCICREGFGGSRCDQCLPGYYNYPSCKPCNCSATGSSAITCDNTGKCNCLNNFAGKQCTLCSAGYFSYPDCLACNCDVHGSEGVTCNADGQCLCLPNFDGKLCDSCKEGFYNFPNCEDCNCDPAGVIDKFAGCGSVPVGELCQCKERVSGRICNECQPLYWNLNISNPDGCEMCDCWTDGTIGYLDTCDSRTGQCTCKPHTQGRTCQDCKDGTYDLDGSTLFGCKDCNCDVGGSWRTDCDKTNGQCKCHPRITGRACTQPLTTHYFPTLYQFQYEYENGYQPSGAQVRYQFDEKVFPGFSSKGYAVFNDIQNEVRNELAVFKSSVYRIVIRYVNQNPVNVTANILIQSENPLEVDQNVKVLLRPTAVPQFVTVSGDKGKKPSAVVLDPGKYTLITKSNKNVMLDYFVLLPAAYYEASILTRKVATPCELENMEMCRHYKYASLEGFQPAVVPFVTNDNGKPTNPNEFYNDPDHLTIINHIGDIPMITASQQELNYIVDVPHSGRYVFVIDYVSERLYTEPGFIRLRLGDDKDNYGSTTVYPCLYSMACRTPIIDEQIREKIFTINKEDSKPVVVYADFDDAEKVAIIAVTAIPAEEWSVNYVIPSPVCVIHNEQCVTPKFRSVPDSKKIEFETDHDDRITLNKPPYAVLDERVKLIYLDNREGEENTIVIDSKVSEPRNYVILVKYYQPHHPNYHVLYTLTAGRNQYDGKFDVNHCPSSAGCRGVIRPSGDEWWFNIEDDFKFTITNNRPQGLWLDYLIVVPVDQYNDDLLVEETFDQTKEFIQECGQEHFFITHNASAFCKKAVFSLTADYNGGALPCNCDYAGSTSFECHPFGGQCQCKPNIINRQCSACRTGYYGFPNCKPCSCPSTATCEPHTGECVCPPNVMGANCDKCVPNTYGYHQIIGCEDCNCNLLGVAHGNTQCDMLNGSCDCRQNIEGRACDTCVSGYFDFPRCDKCACNVAGTELEICDKVDGACFCKKNVVGRDCDQCMEGTYNLQYVNPDGCTTCFCFGKTSRCESAYLRIFNVSLLTNVSLNTANFNENFVNFDVWDIPPEELFINDTTIQADFSFAGINVFHDESVVFFGVLDYLAGQNSHISAYGGELVYSLYYSTGFSGKPLIAPDVILVSKDHILVHQSYEQPSSNQIFKNRVHMVENNFLTQDGKPVTRADFMMALRNLVMIYIRANYWQQTLIAQLSNVYLTLAADNNDDHNQRGYEFLAVEKCHCPPGYSGLSCEDCAPGYYRDPNGPYGGYCIPCECNGHADTCDCVTGICEDCKHYTTGDHCDMCIEGYYGNATFGSPHDCMICACPLPIPGNNFAIGCEISDAGDEIHCDCMPGHTGPRCEFCSNGYYGHPQTPGDYCKPCECSGNINPEEPGSCDTLTGECLRCLNNTFGVACNLCAPGFYGDAVDLKNCQSCDCEELGTLQCDPFVGDCKCHDNIIGSRCDRCKPDHYGYDSGAGCRTCECAMASNSTQCDDHTGKCACKLGVTGRQCDRCAVDHWKYTKDGCTPCNCNQGFSRGFGCNPLSGQCECLPGVIGDRCDACPHRWVLRKDEGCFECDSCHHALLDITDDLLYKIDPVVDEFQSVALAFFTNQKLTYFDELAEKLVPEIQNLDPKSVNLDPSRSTVSDLETEAKMYLKQVNLTIDNAEDSRLMAGALLVNGSRLREEAAKSVNEARGAINSVELLSRNLDTAAGTKIDAALAEAQEYLNHINATSIDLEKNELVLKKATDLLHEISKLIQPTKAQNRSLNMLKDEIGEFSDKLEDLYNWSFVAANRSAEVERLNTLNKMAFENSKFDTVMDQQNEAEKNIADANHLHTNGDITLTEIDAKVTDLVEALNGMQELNKQIDVDLPDMEKKSIEASKEVLQAELKAAELEVRAQDLSEQYAHMTSSAEPALRAATAYQDIVDAVSSAQQFTKDAKYAAGNATEKTNGVEDRAGVADHDSAELLQKARDSLIKVQSNLEPRLNASAAKVEEISKLNEDTEKHLKDVNIAMEALPADSQRDLWKSSNENASDALGIMKDVLDILEPVVKQTTKELDQARNISKDIDLTNKDITQVQNHLNSVESYIPELNTLADDLDEQQAKVEKVGQEMGASIASLKQQIETARQLANSIKVGVKFVPSTILELKPPETVPLLATKSKVSTYFKTENPNGFLLYLGNDNKTATTVPTTSKNDDFMALEIVNGYPILTMDLGKGPERITNEKFVADGNWYQAIVERTGPNVKLTVREELDDGRFKEHVKEEILPGANNVFNVDRNSRLFVGGYPGPSDFTPPEDIHSSSFIGEIEDLRIGDEDVGLWNFVYGEDNTQGSVQRDKLITETIPPTGYRFSGNGHVVLKATPYNFKTRSSIQFSFKADKDAENGLMFFYGRNNHFMSVELVDGTVFFRYQLGDYLVSSGSSDKYNDNEWHRVVAERDGRRGLLKVDDMLIFQEEAPQQADETMPAFKRMFFGGYPGRRNHSLIVEHDFNGCIDDVTIAGNKVDLSQHINAVGAKPGCPKKFSTILGYPPHEYGFLRIANLNSDNKLDVNLKLKTRQKDGIIFYGTNHDQSATVGLTMEDGYLVLRSMGSELMSDMHKLNDGEDHVINIVHDENQLRMTIDDDEDKRLSYPPEPLYIHMGDIFFGGLPENFILPRDALSNSAYYLGCISDVTVNGEIINFADNVEKKNGNINNCPSDILAYDISAVPIYYHGGENELIESVDTKEQERPSIIFRPTPKTTASSTTSRTTISATTKTEAPYYIPRTTQTPTDVSYYTSEKPELIEGIIFETDDKEVSYKPPIQLPERRKPEDPRCQLPIYPNYDVDFTTSGYRFFSVREQRLEVNSLSAKLRRHHSVTFSFRTDYPEGLLFYASDKYHTDYIAVFLNEGRIYHQMHLGVLVANISSAEELNDGEWHTVQFVRGNRKVSLIIDDVEQEPLVELEEKTPRPLVIEFPIFFGGIRKYVEESVRQNIERIGNTSYYNGCLRNIKVNGASLEKELLTYHVVPCSEQIEPGYFFNKPTGYVKLFDRFTVGTDFSLSFDFRPRDPDGLLFSVHGKNTYMILELIDNRLWFTVKSDSKNIVTTNYTLPDDGSYCDGKWRNVHAVKSKFVITISVDYISAKPGVGTEGSTTTKTNRPMFLGGHQAFNKAPGLKTKKTFKGCIRNIQVNKKPVRITPNLVNGEIWQGVCPLE